MSVDFEDLPAGTMGRQGATQNKQIKIIKNTNKTLSGHTELERLKQFVEESETSLADTYSFQPGWPGPAGYGGGYG